MGKVWKVLGIITGIALLLGLICIGVGFITNGDLGQIKALPEAYGFDKLRGIVEELIQKILGLNPLA